ncbi:MAG: DinB family protein [Saprospiraceae bacterium]
MHEKTLRSLARYRQKVNNLLAELEHLPAETLSRKPADGGWSAIQTMQHMALTDGGSLAYVRKKLSFNPELERPGLGAWIRYQLLIATLRSPLRFKAPKSVGAPEVLPNDAAFADVRAAWLKAIDDWENFLRTMPAELADKAVFKHPRAGRLSWAQVIGFFHPHLDRHRGQILRAVKN